MSSICLELRDVSKYYVSGRNVTAALKNVNLTFKSGEFVAVTGESGSGKSTLAHVLAGIIPFESGELLFNGESASQYNDSDWENYKRDNISFVAQNYGVLPGNTALDNVVSALTLAGWEKETAKSEAEKLLRQVELWKQRKRRAARLSSGQKQRLSIARALAKGAPVLIADEPTGNLDPENSRKVIELLAEAAKDRLVIMITHDFKAAKDYVTRRLTIHDGVVRNDVVLRDSVIADERDGEEVPGEKFRELDQKAQMSADTSGEIADCRRKRVTGSVRRAASRHLGRYVAGLQLRARPAWTCFMAAFFALTAFAVFAFLGTFIVSLDDTPTRIFNNEAFRNGADNRLVVSKPDGTGFTEEDCEKLLSLTWAESLEPYDVVLDVNYYYRENVDYEYRYAQTSVESAEISRDAILVSHGCFVRTVPVMKDGVEFLTAGSLPEHMNEVVAAGSESLIGQEIPVYFLDRKNWSTDAYIVKTVRIVGVTDYGSGLYFDGRVGKMLYQSIWFDSEIYGVDETLVGDQMTMTKNLQTYWQGRYGKIWDTINVRNYNDADELIAAKYMGTNPSLNRDYLEMSEELFDRINYQGSCTQVSVFLLDYSYTDRAMEAIREMGYEVISPYRVSSVKVNSTKANERLTTLVLCMLALVMVMAAQIAVLSAMFGLEMKSYAQLSDLGLSCRIGQRSILWQVLLLTAVGQVVGFVFVLLSVRLDIRQFYDVYKYLTLVHLAALSGLHLAGALLVALAACIMLRRQAFPFIRHSTEVDLAELEEKEVQA